VVCTETGRNAAVVECVLEQYSQVVAESLQSPVSTSPSSPRKQAEAGVGGRQQAGG